jgi:hypothetical protein
LWILSGGEEIVNSHICFGFVNGLDKHYLLKITGCWADADCSLLLRYLQTEINTRLDLFKELSPFSLTKLVLLIHCLP